MEEFKNVTSYQMSQRKELSAPPFCDVGDQHKWLRVFVPFACNCKGHLACKSVLVLI